MFLMRWSLYQRCAVLLPRLRTRRQGHCGVYAPAPTTSSLSAGGVATFQDTNVLCRGSPPVLNRLVSDPLLFLEAARSGVPYPRVTHEEVFDEDVFAPAERGDEAVALLLVEPLYLPLRYVLSPPFFAEALPQQKSRPLLLGGAPAETKPTL